MKPSLLAVLVALAAGPALAVDPDYQITHQGFLLGPDDAPVNGSTVLRISLYDREINGNVKWTDQWTVVPFRGRYALELGNTNGDHAALHAADLDGDRWIGINVDGTDVLPRLRVTAVPSAYRARVASLADDATKLGGLEASAYALKTDVPAVASDSTKLGGVDASAYALKTDVPAVAEDSKRLGGTLANQYALKTDLPVVPAVAADSHKLGGTDAAAYALKADVPTKAADADRLGGQLPEAYALASHSHAYLPLAGGNLTGGLNVAGSLGIGTTSPTAKLHVAGTAGVDGIRFPDGTLQVTAAALVPRVFSTTKVDAFVSSATLAEIPGLNVALTPRGTGSKVLITATINYDSTRGNSGGGFRIRRNGQDIDASLGVGGGSRYRVMADFGANANADQSGMHRTLQFLDSPSTTSAVTYSIWLVQDTTSFTTYINRGRADSDNTDDPRMSSTITAIEFP